jgi:chloramphenicol 3-O-phosphotransferase
MTGKVIFLNGAASAGKSTLASALQQQLPLPFWHYSIDHMAFARVLPHARNDSANPAIFVVHRPFGRSKDTGAWAHRILMIRQA